MVKATAAGDQGIRTEAERRGARVRAAVCMYTSF